MMKLVFKVHSEGRYAKSRFPRKLRPHDDELLSSWLIRLALLHRTAPMTFTNLYMPETKNRLWSSDLDLQAGPELITRLAEKSDAPIEDLQRMTLGSYAGYLFETAYGTTGGTPFVNPLGMRGRRNKLPGVRYCPLCLMEDKEPYFRKHWRLSISVACLKHRCYLLDRCQKCGSPVTVYLSCRSGALDSCYMCGEKFVKAPVVYPDKDNGVFRVLERICSIINDGYVIIGYNHDSPSPVYSHLYFQVLHQLLKLMLNRRYGKQLREGVLLDFGDIGCESQDGKKWKAFEFVPIPFQAEMLIRAVWLLENWSERFVEVCRKQKLLSSAMLRDMNPAPFWYWKVVIEQLYRPDRFVTETEIREALWYMDRREMVYSEKALSRLLGVRQVFRKRCLQ